MKISQLFQVLAFIIMALTLTTKANAVLTTNEARELLTNDTQVINTSEAEAKLNLLVQVFTRTPETRATAVKQQVPSRDTLTFEESDKAIKSTITKFNNTIYQTGTASWYGPRFYGRKTASGEIFKKNELTAAHRSLPFGTKLRVTKTTTGKSVVVKVNDRGPFHKNRVIDLSHAAAAQLGMLSSGVCKVAIEKI